MAAILRKLARFAAGAALTAAALASASVPAARAGVPFEPTNGRPLRLYLDCDSDFCDFDFFKRELAWVDWVRDRADADVTVLVATRATTGGGTEATLYVMRAPGAGPAADTLRVISPPAASPDVGRRLVVRTLAAALARDLAVRPEGERLRVTMAPPSEAAAPAVPTRDPWNHWVYKLGTNAYANGEKSYHFLSLYSSVTASRVTDREKLALGLSQRYSESRYTFDDGSGYTSLTRGWTSNGQWVRSLHPRWSAGASWVVYSSSYTNMHLSMGGGPAVEYDVWPYAESSRRALTLGYQVRVSRAKYEAVTLYGKTAETLMSHAMDVTLAQKQTWGTLNFGVSGSQYLHDTSKYRASLSTNADLRLVRGLSIEGYAYLTAIHDQLSLPRGDASDSQVLARQRQLATSYEYYASLGITYRFGSIFDSVVNQRLENTLGFL